MAIIVSEGNGGSNGPAPAGLHHGVCVDVVDMGIIPVTYDGETKKQHKIRVVWQIDEVDDKGQRFIVQKRYTASLHEKAGLRKDLQSWRGRPFTEDERKGFDVEKLIGANAQLNVQHTDDGKFANVVSIVPLGRGMSKLAPTDYIRWQDRQPNGANGEPAISAEDMEDQIPFAWLSPFIMPAMGLLGCGLVFA